MRAGSRRHIGNQDHCRQIVKSGRRIRPVDILINNAAQMSLDAIEEISDEEWEKTLSTNISAMFYIVKAGGA